MFRIIVTGGRYYSNKSMVFDTLDEFYEKHKFEGLHVMEGGARGGADYFARQWVRRRKIDGWRVKGTTMPADWDRYDKAAGPVRNQKMLDTHKPETVVAFPGHRGTRDMINRAKLAGVPVVKTPDWSIYE